MGNRWSERGDTSIESVVRVMVRCGAVCVSVNLKFFSEKFMRGIFLGLGSNCGECSRLLRDALVLLEERGVVVVAQSSIYETEAVMLETDDSAAAKNYLNAVVEVETNLSLVDLLRACDEVERLLGRVRGGGEVRWGARTIDIDILLYGSEIIGWKVDGLKSGELIAGDTLRELVVPHPRMHERNFVLVPFAEIAGEVVHPVFSVSVGELLKRSPDKHRVVVSAERWM